MLLLSFLLFAVSQSTFCIWTLSLLCCGRLPNLFLKSVKITLCLLENAVLLDTLFIFLLWEFVCFAYLLSFYVSCCNFFTFVFGFFFDSCYYIVALSSYICFFKFCYDKVFLTFIFNFLVFVYLDFCLVLVLDLLQNFYNN